MLGYVALCLVTIRYVTLRCVILKTLVNNRIATAVVPSTVAGGVRYVTSHYMTLDCQCYHAVLYGTLFCKPLRWVMFVYGALRKNTVC